MGFWKKIGQFLNRLLSSNDGTSSKRFLAIFIYTPCVIFAVFFDKDINTIIALLSMVAALLGLTSIEKFSKNFKKSDDLGLK